MQQKQTLSLKRNKSHDYDFGAMHIRDNKNKPRAANIKIITPVVYSKCVLKVGDSGHSSGLLRVVLIGTRHEVLL